MNNSKAITAILMGFILLVVFSGFYTVPEGSVGIVVRLGEITEDSAGDTTKLQAALKAPGLHYRMPFLEQVELFDMRLQSLEPPSSSVVTSEQKDVKVDYFIKWRIKDPALYYTRTSNDRVKIDTLLVQQLNDKLRAAFGRRTITEVISDDRQEIMYSLQEQTNASAANLGIEVVDVRIKSLDLPDSVSDAIYSRMRSERSRVATEHRAKGHAQAEAMKTRAEAEAAVVIAKASEQAAQERAKGVEEAAQIYLEAFSKDPEFYDFYRNMQAYRNTFAQGKDVIILQPNNQLFKYFNSPDKSTKRSESHG